ncbi:MAG: glycosyltransferase [Flavobacteriales bacterium]|nr:glycosyltransferase [Flavobacteriales bacterium]
MKILTVLDSYPPDVNGGAYFMHWLAKNLGKFGHNVRVLTASPNISSKFEIFDDVNVNRFSSFNTPLYDGLRLINPILLKSRVKRIFSEFKPDVVHLQGRFVLGDAVMQEAYKQKLPMMVTNHLMPGNFAHHFKIPTKLNDRYEKFTWNWVFQMFHKCQAVVAVSEQAKTEILKNDYGGNIICIPNSVDTNKFKPRQRDTALAAKLKLQEEPILLYTGRIDKEKNLDFILKCVKKALEQVKFKFIITGSGASEKEIKKMIQDLALSDNVIFTGAFNALENEYEKIFSLADVFINACEIEQLSLACLEAISSGLPVIAADAMGSKSIVSQGKNGFLFEPKNLNQVTEQIIRVLKDNVLRDNMGRESRKIALEKYSLDLMCERYIEIYERILKGENLNKTV